jgi:hypothetical protein
VEVPIILILFKAALLDEECDEAKDSQAGHSEADSVVPWEASILLDSRGSRLSGSLEEHSTVFVSLVGRILLLVVVNLLLILANYGAFRVSLVPLTEVVVIAILFGLIELLCSALLIFGIIALRLSLVLSGLILRLRRLFRPSVAVLLTDLLIVVLPLLVLLFVVVVLIVFVVVFLPLSELLSKIKGNLGLHGLKLIALELGPQVERDLRPQLGIVGVIA